MVNLNLYKIFCTVAEEKKISKASEKLYISQPAVSFSIKELEKELNQTLFARKSKGVELTPFGTILYNKINQSIKVFDEAETMASNYSKLKQGIVRIGSSSSNVNQVLLEYSSKFAIKYPDVQIVMTRGSRENLINMLKNNELDMIFVDSFDDLSQFNVVKQLDIKYQLIGNKEYKQKYFGDNTSILNFPVKDLMLPSKNNNSRKTIDHFFEKENLVLNPKYELDNYILLYEFVKKGFGIAFVNIEYYKDAIKKDNLEIIFPNFSINARKIVCLTSLNITNNALEKFVEIINNND
mgnify:CR=1 FL=1